MLDSTRQRTRTPACRDHSGQGEAAARDHPYVAYGVVLGVMLHHFIMALVIVASSCVVRSVL